MTYINCNSYNPSIKRTPLGHDHIPPWYVVVQKDVRSKKGITKWYCESQKNTSLFLTTKPLVAGRGPLTLNISERESEFSIEFFPEMRLGFALLWFEYLDKLIQTRTEQIKIKFRKTSNVSESLTLLRTPTLLMPLRVRFRFVWTGPKALFTRNVLAHFCQWHLLSSLHFVTSCVNSTKGMHSTHFKAMRKTVQKR